MATRRATGGFRRRTRQYVEESDRAQRSGYMPGSAAAEEAS